MSIMDDTVMKESPLQINTIDHKNGKKASSITMRSPGNDAELAVGFMYGEGMIRHPSEIEKVETEEGIANVFFKGTHLPLTKTERNFYITSSCGVCGKSSIEELMIHGEPMKILKKIDPHKIQQFYVIMQEHQAAFKATGGCHGAAVFNYSGELVVSREDVGRHNAVDKCSGYLFNNELIQKDEYILCLSGRSCYELIQKAIRINCSTVISIGAATTLAIETAKAFNITLIGFFRSDSSNVYSIAERIC